jgi:predicted GNAT superfamily acetyltransferase
MVMNSNVLRPPAASDTEAILALSNANHIEVGRIERDALERLIRAAFHVRVAGHVDALLIGLEQGADYASPNYRWFAQRFDRFVYVDRVVVAEAARGAGLARRLYDDFFAAARGAGHTRVCCEVNYDPPNPASDAFHARMGFEEIGRAHLPDRAKSVRYLLRAL